MNRKGSITGWPKVAFILIMVFVLLALFITIRTFLQVRSEGGKTTPLERTEVGEVPQGVPEIKLPLIEEIEEEERGTERRLTEETSELEKDLKEYRLKDIPLDETSSKEKKKEETLQTDKGEEILQTQPSSREIEELKRKGLIIY